MKEASGELNMTLVTIIAIAAIAGIFFAFKNSILGAINNKWQGVQSPDASQGSQFFNNNTSTTGH